MIKQFLQTLDHHGIEYVVWKSIEDLELLERDCSVELDLYVPENYANALRALAAAHGFAHRSTTVERYTDFFYIVENKRLVMLHVAYRIITGAKLKNFHLDIGDDLIRSRKMSAGVWVSDPKPLLCYHVLKYVLLGVDRHWDAIVAASEDERRYANRKMNEAFGPGLVSVEALSASNRDEQTRRALRRRVIRACRADYWRYSIRHILDRVGTRLRWIAGRRGFTVAFVGVDGSGKSTLSQDVSQRLGFLGSRSAYYVGPNKRYPRPLRFAIRLATVVKASMRVQIGGVSIYDRYLYDMLTYRKLPKTFSRFLYKMIPAPDFTFFCDSPVDVILARKSHEQPDELRSAANNFRELLDAKPRTHFLDTTRDAQETIAEVMAILGPRIRRSLI